MDNIGYQRALNLAKEELAKLSPEEVVANTGVVWTGTSYEIPWLGQNVPLEEGKTDEQIIWHHYMAAKGPKQLSGRYITFKQAPGASIYDANFTKRCINPMVKTFSNDLDEFLRRGKALGGTQVNHGHMAFTLPVLPYTPITYVIWQGDDEIPSNGNVLFDETVVDWFCAEDLVVIASLPVYRMLRMQGPRPLL